MALIVCPDCGAADQEVGKFCENCGRLLSDVDNVDAQPQAAGGTGAVDTSGVASPAADTGSPPDTGTSAAPDIAPGVATATATAPPPTTPTPPSVSTGAQFAVVREGQPSQLEGFTIAQPGEYLVGRPDLEAGTPVDIDVRQWVQPLEVRGQKQYLIHRKQCYLGLTPEGKVTIKAYPGYEEDTLIKAAGQNTFTSLQAFGTVRAALQGTTYPLEKGDQIYMGDPEGVRFYRTGAATAKESYLVLEVVNTP